MARPTKTVFVCSECGRSEPRWLGQCPGCEAWSTLAEERAPQASAPGPHRGAPALAGRVVPLAEVPLEQANRLRTGIGELDRVLGGGLVPGSHRAARRRARHRQVEPDRRAAREARRSREGAADRRRGVARPGAPACRAARCRRGRGGARRDQPRGRLRDDRRRGPRRLRGRLGAVALERGARLGARHGLAGARGSGATAAARQGPQHRDHPRRARDEGRRGRRSARARASRRCDAGARGRPGALPAGAAGLQEPLRVDRRDRPLRDERCRPRRGARRLGPLRSRRRPPARLVHAARARGLARARARRAGARRAVRARAAAASRERLRPEPALAAARRDGPPWRARVSASTTSS